MDVLRQNTLQMMRFELGLVAILALGSNPAILHPQGSRTSIMLAPIPIPRREASPHDADATRLEIRLGAGRIVSYPMAADEFLIGGATGCDLRLSGSNVPPVVCQFTQSDDGLRVRKLAPNATVLLNDKPLNGSTPSFVRHGDRVSAGPAEIVVQMPNGTYLYPRLVPLEVAEEPAKIAPNVERRIDAVVAELRRLEESTAEKEAAEIARQRDELARERAELDEDRVRWYRHRQEIEAELQKPRTIVTAPPVDDFREREAAMRTREQEQIQQLADARAALENELAGKRLEADNLLDAQVQELERQIAERRLQFEKEASEYEPRLVELHAHRERLIAAQNDLELHRQTTVSLRDELHVERNGIDTERAQHNEYLSETEAANAERTAELLRRETMLKADRDAIEIERAKHKEDLLRIDRWQGTLESHHSTLVARAAEIDQRFQLLHRNSGELEETVKLADSEQDLLKSERERLEKWRTDLETESAVLAERAEQLEAQQAVLAVLRTKLDRQQDEMRHEAAAFASDRVRLEHSRAELDTRLRDAEHVRAELGTIRDDHAVQHTVSLERNSLLAATLDDIQRQKDDLSASEERIHQKEIDLDTRSAEFAEQAAILKSRAVQMLELQARLEADRQAMRDREAAFNDTDAARLSFQDQLSRRADELSKRAKQVDARTQEFAALQAELDRQRSEWDTERLRQGQTATTSQQERDEQTAELQKQAAVLSEREATLARQVARLKEVGESVAAERKAVFEARAAWEAERTQAAQTALDSQEQTEAFRTRVAAHFAELRGQAPDLDDKAQTALNKLSGARDVLRGQLSELQLYAKQTREELDAARANLREESERIRLREEELERTRAEQRVAVTGFRQQLVEWQAKVGELRQGMGQSESRVEQKQAELEALAEQTRTANEEIAKQATELRQERKLVAEKRSEMERHLGDMRDWYRRKLRELAAGRTVDETDLPSAPQSFANAAAARNLEPAKALELTRPADTEPGDVQLGELLRSRGLLDEPTLNALKSEAQRQRRTLRQVLLASGAVTLYQLALIEAGNLEGLILGRFRVVDRVRTTAKETVYRVFDPSRANGPTRGVYVLRQLSENEMANADDFRQRFGAMIGAGHPNLANTMEVLDVQRRPAALQEWVSGLSSADWPPAAATAGVWLRLLNEAAKGLHHAHKAGLVHGRLIPESFVLTADGTLKIQGFGEPSWLTPNAMSPTDLPPSADLRGLGQVAFVWSQLGSRRKGARSKPFPAELTAVIRRLEIGSESPMGDVVAIDRPYADTSDLLRDLARLAESNPCPSDAWEKVVRFAGENSPDMPVALRQTA